MKKTILIAAVMFLAFTVAASAQALLQVGSTPVTTVASCGTTELTGDVQFSLATASNPIVTGTITINYGVPITSLTTANWTVTIGGVTQPAGTFVTNISTQTDLNAGRLVLQVTPAGAAITTFDINGVRVNIAGNPTLTNLTATVSAGLPQTPGQPVNSFLGGQTQVVVVQSVASAIANVTVSVGAVPGPLTTLAVSPNLATTTVNVTEGFLNAWVQNSMIQLTFTGVPAGVTLSFPLIVSTSVTVPGGATTFYSEATLASTAGVASPASPFSSTNNVTSTGAPITVQYRITAVNALSASTLETLKIPVGLSLAPGAAQPLALGTATVTANMVGIVDPNLVIQNPPQYTGTTCQKGPANFLVINAATTNLLIPYATTAAGYDVGIAIANTTNDPFTTGSATDQSGEITFYFFNTNSQGVVNTFSWKPTGSTGGLTGGKLAPGAEFVYLLSQLLKDAGQPALFNGNIYAVCNFTNAHGQYFISDFAAFTNGALMLVVPLPRPVQEQLMH